jgi:hypothetical protein
MRLALAGGGVRVECGLCRGVARRVGGRTLSVLAWQVGLRWRGWGGAGAWGMAHPLALREADASGEGAGRWQVVPDLTLLALVGGVGLLAWLWRGGRAAREA